MREERSATGMDMSFGTKVKRERLLFVSPERVQMRRQMREARVRAKGVETQMKRPTLPIVIVVAASRFLFEYSVGDECWFEVSRRNECDE